MRLALALGFVSACILASSATIVADEIPQRHGVSADYKAYPQATPKDALASILKAVEDKRIDYVLAHLADPQWVDECVKKNGDKFEYFVKECKETKLDPGAVKQLRRFLQDGEWKIEEKTAESRLKDVPDRSVRLFKIGDRWYLENGYKPDKSK
jgi:hypothetical protein